MARGTTTDYSVNGTKILKRAFIWSGIYGPNSSIPPEETVDALDVINMMIKLWQGSPDIETKGLKMWQRARATLTLTAAISFSLKLADGALDINPPVDILTAMLKDTDDNETSIVPMMGGLGEFEAISDKTETGTPSKYYYERQYDEGTLYLNCVPEDITDVIDLVYLRPIYDMDAVGNDVDFLQHWYEALYMNLGLRLMPGYGKPISQDHKDQAKYALDKAQSFYPENVNVFFEPDRDD